METKIPISTPVLPVGTMLDSRSSSSSAASSPTPSQQSSRRNSSGPASTALGCPESSSIAGSLNNLTISEKEPKQMFSILGTIFHRAEQEEGFVLSNEFRTVYEEADEIHGVGYRAVEALRVTKGILHQMWERRSKYFTDAAKVLADASRDRTLRQLL